MVEAVIIIFSVGKLLLKSNLHIVFDISNLTIVLIQKLSIVVICDLVRS